jgi:uncharacterized membrane protein YadS
VLIAGIACIVAVAIAASYAIGRAIGLPRRMSILIACGNSICGNSAIAAVAPVIGADSDDVASSISFTAVLGVAVVLGLPFLVPVLQLCLTQYGVLAGLTVYDEDAHELDDRTDLIAQFSDGARTGGARLFAIRGKTAIRLRAGAIRKA